MKDEATRAGPRRGYAALVAAVAGIVALTAAINVCIRLPGVPYNVPEIFPASHQVVFIAIFSALLLVTGFAPGAVAGWIVRRPQYALWTPAAAAGAALAAWALVRASVTTERIHKILGFPVLQWGWDWELICRFLALYGGVMLILIVGATIVAVRSCGAGAVGRTVRRGAAGRSGAALAVGMILFSLPWLALARLVVINWADAGDLTELIRTEPYPGDVLLAAGVLMIGLNAAWLARAFLRPGWVGAAVAIAVTIALVAPGWLLLNLGLVPTLTRNDLTFSAVQFLLRPDGQTSLSESNLFLRWGAVQIAAVVVLAYGGWIALRLLGPGTALPDGERRSAGASRVRAARGGPEAGAASPARAAIDPPDAAASPARASSGRPDDGLTGLAAPGRFYWLVAVLYLAFVIYGSLVPLDYTPVPLEEAWERFAHAQYLAITIGGRADLVANLLLFIPLTFLFMGSMTRENLRRPRWPVAALVAVLAAALAVGIEFTQVFFPPRTVSLNDMMNESIGGGVGIAGWLLLGGRLSRWVRGMWQERVRHALTVKILIAYTFLMIVYQLLPFDLTIRPVELWDKLKGGSKITLVPFADKAGLDAYMMAIKVAIMIPVGVLLAHVARPRGRAIAGAAARGFLVAAGIEAAQLFVYSRYSSATDVILGTLGAILGWWLADRVGPIARRPLERTAFWQRHGRWIRPAAAVGAAAALLAVKWRPLRFQWPDRGLADRLLESIHVPFYYQYWNSEFGAAAQLLRDTAHPMILGLVIAWAVGGQARGRLIAAMLAGGLGLCSEMGDVLFPPHVTDPMTAVLSAAAGAAGAILYRRFADTFIRTPKEGDGDALHLST